MPKAADEIDPIALAVLHHLEEYSHASEFVLDGYFALQQYARINQITAEAQRTQRKQ